MSVVFPIHVEVAKINNAFNLIESLNGTTSCISHSAHEHLECFKVIQVLMRTMRFEYYTVYVQVWNAACTSARSFGLFSRTI